MVAVDAPPPHAGASRAPRVVLDTNVCLDLLVFRDPRTTLLAELLHQRRLIALTNAGCRAEWQRVLAYPPLRLGAQQQQAALAGYDGTLHYHADSVRPEAAKLPRCADPDDQIFLELAQIVQARLLLTRDAALLALSARTQRIAGFRIVPPDALASALQMLD